MDKKRVLFLDDRSKRIHSAFDKYSGLCDLTIVATVAECLRFLSSQDFNVVYLDHDLGGEEFVDSSSQKCGMEVVRYIENCWPPEKEKPLFIIHSSNIFAAITMEDRLKRNGFPVRRERWEYE